MSAILAAVIKLILGILSLLLFAFSSGHLAKKVEHHPVAKWGAGVTALLLAAVTIGSLFFPLPMSSEHRNSQTPIGEQALNELLDSPKCSVGYFDIDISSSMCGFMLTEQSELYFNGRVVSPRLIVSHLSSDETFTALNLSIFPEPKMKRYFVFQACDQSLCWGLWKFDRKHWSLEKTFAGKYGPEPWIRWSVDGEVAIMFNRNEGAVWLHSIYMPENLRDHSSRELDSIEPKSFEWISSRRFRIRGHFFGESGPPRFLAFDILRDALSPAS